MKEGIFNISNETYHADEGYSSSQVKKALKSMGHLGVKIKQTDSMILGTAVHTFILEGDKKFYSEFAVSPKFDKRTKQGKADSLAFNIEADGKQVITEDKFDKIRRMSDSFYDHPIASNLLLNGMAEQSIYYIDEETGLQCKVRPDYLSDYIVDLKTSASADPSEFSKTCANFGYHISAAMYMDGVRQTLERVPTAFYFIVVENQEPFTTEVFVASSEMLEFGHSQYRKGLERIRAYDEGLIDDSYSNGKVNDLNLPKWAYYVSDNS